ncbi:MAG: HD domain-containing protein, partial [Oscillospiraceae bacterium]|nr:HD domain-containing protein [Oscillospiraceae bacterium]
MISPTRKTLSPISSHRNFITLLMCLTGVAVNLLLGKMAEYFHFPLYLDTVGTIAAAIMGGYLPGVIVGFLTNMIKGISDPSSVYYGILNVMIATSAAFFNSRGVFRKWYLIPLPILVFALIGGGLGTCIPWLLDDLPFESESLSGMLYDTGMFTERTAQLIASFMTDLVDKTITVLLVMLIIALLPPKVREYCSFNGWMQTPLSNEESEAARKLNFRVMSLRTKIMLVLTLSLAAISVAATVISMQLYRSALIKDHKTRAESVARIAAGVIDPEAVDSYLAEGVKAPGYAETERLLYEIRDNTEDIQYLYVYRIEEDGCHVVFDLDTAELEGGEPGEVIPFDESFSADIPMLLAGEEIEPIITNDTYGWLLTSYVPVYTNTGRCVCYAAADISMERIGKIEQHFLVEMLCLFLGIFFVIFVLIYWLIEYHIILPVNSIAMSTGEFAYDSDTSRESSIERIHELNIHTGDEVENLYHAISKTSDDSMRYVADVQKKTQEIAQMQNALILVLADIVESRDRNTGAHVRKTAAYTGIILHRMKAKGLHPEILTDQYISDVINSAPLHDVGKIQVPDAILNKPGRLNDEEFEIMKSHTTAGQEILTEAISLVPNSGYLDEARNLAAYHHEKWDGTGYPTGISGEDIPLSARVMAVADVFDALVSKRSYKKPFTFEEAKK